MAEPAVIRKLLLRYFNTAPRAEIEPHLETMFLALAPAQRQALISAAKNFLLPFVTADFAAVSGTLDALYAAHLEILIPVVANAADLVDEVKSL